MTGPREHEPDPAALDELRGAFGGPEADRRPAEDVDGDPTAVASPQIGFDPESPEDDLLIVEQTSTAPRIIRIDDYGSGGPIDESLEPRSPAGRSEPSGSDGSVVSSSRPNPVEPDLDVRRDVIVITDDDLPDPVRIEAGADGSTILIIQDDDDVGSTDHADAERSRRRGIEPRLRERRVAVKRAEGRKRLKWVVLALVIGFGLVAALAVLGSPLFAVRADQVTVTGNVYTDAERLAVIVDDLVGTPSLRVDTKSLERRIEEIPWVDEARVRVRFPYAASIDIRERAAMTTYQGPDGRFRVLDREGRVLDVIEKYPFAYLLIDGPDPVDLAPGTFAPTGYAAASELAKNLTASVRGRIEYVDVTADGSRLVLHLDDESTVYFGEARDLFVKLLRLETVLAADPGRQPGPIDVSTDDVTL